MQTEILAQLNTGIIPFVLFSKLDAPPSAPYGVLKPETYSTGRGFRCIVHCNTGCNDELDGYIFNDLSVLLKDYEFTDANGNNVVVKDAGEWTDIVVDNDDNTISMERLFYVPMRLH